MIATILHLFFWIVLWLFLTVKQRWTFKLRVTVGRAAVRGARSIKLLNDVDLDNDGGPDDAMMIVAQGKSFSVSDDVAKKAIMGTLARAAMERDEKVALEEERGEQGDGGETEALMGNAAIVASPAPARQRAAADAPDGRYVLRTLRRAAGETCVRNS